MFFFNGKSGWFQNNIMDVVLVGVPETRNSDDHASENASEIIRKWLYGMRKVSGNVQIADAGNVRGNSLKDRYQALTDVVNYFSGQNIFILLLGGSQDLTLPACQFIRNIDSKSSISIVDAFLDVDISGLEFTSSAYINKLVDDLGEKIDDLTVLGTQLYYCSGGQEQYMNDHFFPVLRLRDLRQDNINHVEVVLRDTTLLSFDFSSIENQPALTRKGFSPNGFSNVEACRIFWYAGASDVLKVAGLFNVGVENNNEKITGPLAAQMLWHFFEGMGARGNDFPSRSVDEYEYRVVSLEEYGENLHFYHNPDNNRWWIKVPCSTGSKIVACHLNDYKQALEKELPEVWWRHFHKTNRNIEKD